MVWGLGVKYPRLPDYVTASSRRTKPLVSSGQRVYVRALVRSARDIDLNAVHLLEPMFKHRAIAFLKDVQPDLSNVVWADAQYVFVKSRVVKLAEGKAVTHHWLSVGVGVRDDVCGFQEFRML